MASARSIVEEIHIDAPPSRVYRALVEPHQLVRWWTEPGGYESFEWIFEARPGGVWRSTWRSPGGTLFRLGGTIQRCEPPHRLELDWYDERFPGLARTTVLYEIEARATGSLVRVTHTGFDGTRVDYDEYAGGWSEVLRRVRTYLTSRPEP